MLKLKSALKKAIFNDPFESIYCGQAGKHDYRVAIQHFQSLSAGKKSDVVADLTRKINKLQSNKITIAVLILCDYLSSTNPDNKIVFPHKLLAVYQQAIKKGQSRTEKTKMVENNLALFYLEYLRVKVWMPCTYENPDNLTQSTQYCEQAIETIKNILNYDFIIEYAVEHLSFKELIKIMVENILRRVSEDLTILIKFVNKFTYLIVEESPQSVQVNEIYEQLIYMSKNVGRFEKLNRSIGADIKFPQYRLDRGLNSTIEQAMMGRQKEKMMHHQQRRIITQQAGQEQELNEGEMTQAEIFFKHNTQI